MKTIQLQLPDNIAEILLSLPGSVEEFIIETVENKFNKTTKKEINGMLVAGYKASGKEAKKIAGDFDSVDIDNWDEY